MQHSPDQWVEVSAARSEVGRVSKEAFLPPLLQLPPLQLLEPGPNGKPKKQ